ncbi:MAG: 50S ribosomal protein L22 [Kofleriaceae bacterium]|nr:MAG: 50S ribosomal protein L22 [Kofleriaceae bacterium]MBZ0233833.1 50S ribosomal protein L22 [Kofleriaceae bacterium]
MEARALVRGISMSPRKMRVVANLVRGKGVEEAVGLLDLMPKKAARLISKAVKSAAANAEEKSGGDVSVEDLHIHTITVDGGPIIKRWMPRSMGRANRIQHRTSHLMVVVSDEHGGH